MTTLLLIIIYFAFISLGLPDAVLGGSWPTMYQEFGVPVSYAGILLYRRIGYGKGMGSGF